MKIIAIQLVVVLVHIGVLLDKKYKKISQIGYQQNHETKNVHLQLDLLHKNKLYICFKMLHKIIFDKNLIRKNKIDGRNCPEI